MILLALVVVFSFFNFPLNTFAATSGPNNPATTADDSSVGTVTWSNTSRIVSSNNSYATASLGDNVISHYIKATNFGFTIPVGATITGITAEVEKKSANANRTQDYRVRIIKGGTIGSTDKSNTNWWGTANNVYTTYGGVSDLWGETWTYSDINNTNFGLALSAYKNTTVGGNESASIDHIKITITYTTNTTPNAPTLVSPSSGSYTTDNTPTLSANYSDSNTGDTGTTNYRIATSSADCLAGIVVASGTSTTTSTNNENTTWIPGSSIGSDATYYWCAQNNDGVATSAWTSMGNFILDTTNPTSTISTPSNNSYSSSTTVALTGTSSDANLSSTTISVDGGLFVATSGTAAAWTYSATGLSQGAHTFQSKATDLAGNTGLSSVVNVTVDTVAPTVPGTPTISTTAYDDTPTWEWTASTDNSGSGLATPPYIVEWSKDSSFSIGIFNSTSSINSFTHTDTLSQDTWYFRVKAVNIMGNYSAFSANGSVTILPSDIIAPTSPTNLTSTDHTVSVWSNDNTITVNWDPAVDTGSGVAGYSYIFDTNEDGTTEPDTTQDINAVTTITSGALSDSQTYYFNIRAVDNFGNWGNTVHLGPFFIDTTSAEISFTHNVNYFGTVNNNSPSITWLVDQDNPGTGGGVASYECKIDAESFASCSSPKSYSGLANGLHTFEVRATEVAGNISTASHSWTIDTITPTVSSITRVNSSPTNASSVDYTVTFSEPVSDIDTNDFSLTESGVSGSSVTSVSASSGLSVVVTVNTGSDDGTLRLDISNTATITDTAGNNLSGLPFTTGEYYEINKSDLTVNITASSPINTDPIPVSIEFSSGVLDFDSTDIGLSSGTVDGFIGSGTTYNFNIISHTEGTITITISNSVAHDSATNGNLSTSLEIIYDITPSTVTEVTSIPEMSNNTSPSYTFNSTEAGTVIYGGSCGVASATIATAGNNTVIFGPLSSGLYSDCTIIVTDSAGNPSTLLTIPSFEIDSNLPVTKFAVSCMSSTFTVGTDINCTVTRLNASDVEITSGSNEVNLSSSSGSASFDQTTLIIGSGSSSTDFVYTDSVAGAATISASSFDISISSGSFNITASSIPIVSTKINMTVDSSSVCTSDVVGVTLQAVDDNDSADTLLDGNVMISATGGAIPNSSPIHIVGGFAQINIANTTSETIQISLVDVDTGKIMPSNISVTFRTCGGGGGGSSSNIAQTVTTTDIAIAGKGTKATGGSIDVYGINVSGTSTANLVPLNLGVKQNADGSFAISKNDLPANFPALGIQYVDSKGNKAPLMLYNNANGIVNVKSANIAPTVSVADDHFAFFTYVRGFARGNRVTLYVDNKEYKSAEVKADGSYEIQLSSSGFEAGKHSFYVKDSENGRSLEEAFQVVNTRIPRADVNKDGKVNLSDFSAFNATFLYAKNGGEVSDSLKTKFDLNRNGSIDQGDLSVMLQGIKR
ncbi:MAG: Ig-like domain-containing protein [Minisyncoccia bacterium]